MTKTNYVDVLGSEVRELEVGDKLEINGVEGFEVTETPNGWVDLNNDYPSSIKHGTTLSTLSIQKFIEGDSHAKTIRKLVEVVEENKKVKVDEWLYGALESLDGYTHHFAMIKLVNLVYDGDLESKYPLQMLVNCLENGYELEYEFKVGDIVKGVNSNLTFVWKDTMDKQLYTLVCKAENREDN